MEAKQLLAYGMLPDFDEFEAAFYKALVADGVHSGMYRIILGDLDARMDEATGIDIPRLSDCESLYGTLEQLCAVNDGHYSHGEPWTDEQMEWAGEFASRILATLGFEWV